MTLLTTQTQSINECTSGKSFNDVTPNCFLTDCFPRDSPHVIMFDELYTINIG